MEVIFLLSSISNHQETPLSGAEVGVGGRQDLEGVDSVREVTEKLVRDCVTLWATVESTGEDRYSEVPGESLRCGDLRTSTG